MAVSALIPWYGSDRMIVDGVGEQLVDCEWVGIPCAGGMAAAKKLKARTIVINDVHRHSINLGRVIQNKELKDRLLADVSCLPFHPDVLTEAQRKAADFSMKLGDAPNYEAGLNYFIAVWMGRSATAGTPGELRGKLALRWNAGGGDSAVRFRSGIEAIEAFYEVFLTATFSTLDIFEFLEMVHDKKRHGLYVDPPWPGPGDKYRHTFPEADHVRLSLRLLEFDNVRVVVRYGDHPKIRELYPETRWKRVVTTGRDQANGDKPEFLLVRN